MLQLALVEFTRERNNAEFRILAIALAICVFAITTLTCLSNAVQRILVEDGAQVLGADLILESPDPFDPVLVENLTHFADENAIKITALMEFYSMSSKDDKVQLVSVYAISGPFPLHGDLSILDQNHHLSYLLGPPPPGQIWIEESLAALLNVKVKDSIQIGNVPLLITGILKLHPAGISNSFMLAPLIYINAYDMGQIGVLQEGSRAIYRILFSANENQVKDLARKYKENIISHGIKWITLTEGRSSLFRLITEGKRYLSIIMIIQILLAATAIAIAAHQYAVRKQKNIAIWRCFGAENSMIVATHALILTLLAMSVLSISIALGYGTASGLIYLAYQFQYFPFAYYSLGWQGALLGAFTGIIMLIGFALPPLIELRRVSPMQILQRDQVFSPSVSIFCFSMAILSMGGIVIFFLNEAKIGLRLASEIVGMSILAWGIGWILWHSFLPLSRILPLSWRFGLSYMARHKWQGVTQNLVFTVIITLLLLIQIIQQDFIRQWQAQLPLMTPNYFLLNIQDRQIQSMQEWFQLQGIAHVQFYPIVQGRMTHVNGIKVSGLDLSIEQNIDAEKKSGPIGLNRPIYLTWMSHLPEDNKVIAGNIFESIPHDQPWISIEKGFAERQSLKLGDTISFQIAEKLITAKIVQLRTVLWGSFKPNFFVIFPPGVIDSFPHSYITSVYLPDKLKPQLSELSKKYIEISIIDIDQMLAKARNIISNISSVLDVLLGFVFLFGVLIMYASLLTTLKERLQESALIQILGANKPFVLKMLLIEFGTLGFISSAIANIMVFFIARDIASYAFELSFTYNIKLIIFSILVSIIGMMLLGVIGARSVFRISPLWLLRQTS